MLLLPHPFPAASTGLPAGCFQQWASGARKDNAEPSEREVSAEGCLPPADSYRAPKSRRQFWAGALTPKRNQRPNLPTLPSLTTINKRLNFGHFTACPGRRTRGRPLPQCGGAI